MRLLGLALFFLLSYFFISCSVNEEKEREQAMKKEIMDIHDNLMPKMDDIMKLKSELKERKETLANDTSIIDSTIHAKTIQQTDSLIHALDNADESMMDWMRNYDALTEDMSHEENMEYLLEEKAKIEEVRLEMLSSIKEAQNVLE